MTEYLKMADEFKGTVVCTYLGEDALQELTHGEDAGENYHLEDDAFWLATSKSHMEYAAHAINHHDSLVEENERLRKLLSDVLKVYDADLESDFFDQFEQAVVKIEEALGETK